MIKDDEKVKSEEEIKSELIQSVNNLTPDTLRGPEKKDHILDVYNNGLDLIAQAIMLLHEESGEDIGTLAQANVWLYPDFLRSILTNPLPKQEFQYEGKVPENTIIADGIDWSDHISRRRARVQLAQSRRNADFYSGHIPKTPDEGRDIILQQSDRKIVVEASGDMSKTVFHPALVYNWHHGLALSCIPEVNETTS